MKTLQMFAKAVVVVSAAYLLLLLVSHMATPGGAVRPRLESACVIFLVLSVAAIAMGPRPLPISEMSRPAALSLRSLLIPALFVIGAAALYAPGLSVGYYGAPPTRDYWRAVKGPASPEYKTWMSENDKLHPLADAVVVLYPSLYTFYPDREGWSKYAIAQITEARRYAGGKPVFVFLWPQYHESNVQLTGTYLPPDYWLRELQTAKEYADGVVIWGGWDLKTNKAYKWDEDAQWWKITIDFLTATPGSVPAPPQSPNIVP